ncbi:MAG: glycosyltransferase [Candidatus Omnitrophica bacterium]|nr:glycosyltransferase [Candidatus Omnitrophota bacterium]
MNKQRIKVIQLIEWFERGGGIEQITGEIVCGINPDRFDVEIWCVARPGSLVEVYRQKGFKVRVLNIRTYHNIFNIMKLVRLFREVKPDIIHSHMYFAATIGRVAGKWAGVPCMINHVHSTYWHYSKFNLWIERFLSRWTRKIVCVSEIVRDFVVNYERIDSSKTMIVHNGIGKEDEHFDKRLFKESLQIPSNHSVIICVASLLHNKGHHILLESLSILKSRHVPFTCLIVGGGPEEQKLKDRAQKLGLVEEVLFLGTRHDVSKLLSIADVFVLVSLEREGLPVSILEAMAYGVCVVASQVGGIVEILKNGQNGILIPPYDPDVLAHYLVELINDPQHRERLVKAALQTYQEEFSREKMVDRLENLYEECLRS